MRILIFASVLTFAFTSASAQQVNASSVETSFKNFLSAGSSRISSGGALPVFLVKENTKGNRYLFDKWVNGWVVGTQNVTYKAPNTQFNYDKMTEKLLVLVDGTTVIELNTADILSFTIGEGESQHTFVRLKNSTDEHFYEQVTSNNKGYALYKQLITKLKKADYETNGIFESGNKFDEYKDEYQYFVVTPKQELLKITAFKEKVIKNALGNEAKKVDTFISSHKGQKIDEQYVKGLIEYVNSES
ncbi:MAG: hypothetical protein ACM3VS_05275 [Candidatus Dadabacteria bacterium]